MTPDSTAHDAQTPKPVPEVEVNMLVRAGFNGFAAELLVESVRKFKDFETHGPFAFRLRGVKITLEYDAPSDESHKARRERAGVPRDDYHWAERTNGELAAIVKEPSSARTEQGVDLDAAMFAARDLKRAARRSVSATPDAPHGLIRRAERFVAEHPCITGRKMVEAMLPYVRPVSATPDAPTCEHEWKADMAGVDLKGGTATRFFHRCAKCGAESTAPGGGVPADTREKCRHCGTPIKRQGRDGWVHADGIGSCPHTFAEPHVVLENPDLEAAKAAYRAHSADMQYSFDSLDAARVASVPPRTEETPHG